MDETSWPPVEVVAVTDTFLSLVDEGWDGREMHDGLEVVRALEMLTESLRG